MVLNPRLTRPAPVPPVDAHTARVVRVDTEGAWVTVLGDDQLVDVIGPCYGAPTGLPAGALVLLVSTSHGPWIAAVHEPEEGP